MAGFTAGSTYAFYVVLERRGNNVLETYNNKYKARILYWKSNSLLM